LIPEQFETAAEEFQKCLDLQMKHLEPDDRLIAETYPRYNIDDVSDNSKQRNMPCRLHQLFKLQYRVEKSVLFSTLHTPSILASHSL